MVELSNGRVVHASRIEVGGDLHEAILKEIIRVKNRWVRKLDETKALR